MTRVTCDLTRSFFTCGLVGDPSPAVVATLMRRAADHVADLHDAHICDLSMTLAERHGDENVVTVYFQRAEGSSA